MDNTQIKELIDQLDDDLDSLKDALKPITDSSVTELAAKYPVLDQAKLYVLITYAIESAIFSYVRLTGQDARQHPVFMELERVKQYFQKLKAAESRGPSMRLDKAAVNRIIKFDLASNKSADAREKAAKDAAVAATRTNKAESDADITSKKRKAEAIEERSLPESVTENGAKDSDDESSEEESEDTNDQPSKVASGQATPKQQNGSTKKHKKKAVVQASEKVILDEKAAAKLAKKAAKKERREQKELKREKRQEKTANKERRDQKELKREKRKEKKQQSEQNSSAASVTDSPDTTPAKKKRKKNKEKDKLKATP